MKITDKIISIPPYISTTWDKVSSLHMRDKDVVITLKDNTQIVVPHLSSDDIQEIYNAHATFLEHHMESRPAKEQPTIELAGQQGFQLPFRILFGSMDSLNQALQHNPAYSNLPPLPPEIMSKLEALAKALPAEEVANLMQPVEGCNCIYCQMARLLKHDSDHPHKGPTQSFENAEEEVNDEELRFEQWSVMPLADKMYQVTNKLDPQEHYSVYLGDPIGCTCGKANCEHIVAVLRH